MELSALKAKILDAFSGAEADLKEILQLID